MKKLFAFVVALIVTFGAFAQTEADKKDNDPLDITLELKKIDEYGVPTIKIVDEMRTKAETLYSSKSWSEAIVAYDEFAKQANWLANLLSQCVEPYYSASYNDKDKVSFSTLKKYIPYESKSNEYKKLRDQAYVRIGLCYKNLGDVEKAVAYLYKGLDLVNVDSESDWSEAATALSELIGFTQ
jgi:tetratricopeptide (TPR) repeat protein